MTQPRRARLLDADSGNELARPVVADTPTTRMVGLLAHAGLPAGDGIVLDPCRLIHTWFMRFAIDVVFVSGDWRVVKTIEHLDAFRFAWGGTQATRTVELASGMVQACQIRLGQRLRLEFLRPEEPVAHSDPNA